MAVGNCSQLRVELHQLDNGPYVTCVLLHILQVEYILGCMEEQMDIHEDLEMVDRHSLYLHDDHPGLVQSGQE